MPTPHQSLWMLGATLSFALMAVFVKYASSLYGPVELLFYRSVVSALLVAVYAKASGLHIGTPHWASHSRRAIYGTYSMGVWYYTLSVLPLATAVTLNYSSPIFVALIAAITAWRWRGRPGSSPQHGRLLYLAVAAGFIGVVVLVNPRMSSDHLGASLLGLSAAFAASLSFRDVRRLVGLGEPEWRLVFYLALNSAFYAFVVMIFGAMHAHTPSGIGLLLLVGLFGTLGQWCLSRAFGRGHVLMSASLQYSGVVFAAIFGVALWGEVLPLQSWIGIAIISAAGILATVATKRGKPAVEAA